MSRVKELLEQIKSQAETNTDVEFYDQGDTRTEFQDLADLADTALQKNSEVDDVLEQALFQLNICFAQITTQSENEFIYDDDTGNDVSVESVRAFLVDNLDKA